MKSPLLKILLVLSTLANLFLAACQPVPTQAAQLSATPAEAATAIDNATPAPPGETITEIAPTGTGFALPPIEAQDPAGWQVLENGQRGYSLAYPPEWSVCQKTRYSWTFCELEEDPQWIGRPIRLYISVFPKDYTNDDWEVYNFIPTETIRDFMNLPIGESKPMIPGSPRPEYATYTRLPDQMVAGWNAPVIENTRLWNMPSGTRERVVFILAEDTTYILGMYYETSEQIATFQQVLDRFSLAKAPGS